MPRICEAGGADKGLLLPILGDSEAEWPDWLQAALYFVGLIWCFMGVALIADVFMGAIEAITSKKRPVRNPKTGRVRTVKVWNGTCANLTLMALGSSAPEIMLNVKEIFENNFYAGPLGPMTIVGSAAFNLLIIIAVCVVVIPEGETRAIKDLGVYMVTAGGSIFAYLWVLFILIGPTPNCVDVKEGILTFLFFPILVVLAYLADVMGKSKSKSRPETSQDIKRMTEVVRKKYGKHLTEAQIVALIDFEFSKGQVHSRAYHRRNATRSLFRSNRMLKDEIIGKLSISHWQGHASLRYDGSDGAIIAFSQREYVCLESQGHVELKVVRSIDTSTEAVVLYETEDGTAHQPSDYKKTQGKLCFLPGETEKTIKVGIVNDDGHEATEHFFVRLSLDTAGGNYQPTLGDNHRAKVHIVDENQPGKLAWEEEEILCYRKPDKWPLEITVERRGGLDGKICASYYTEDFGAVAGADYEQTSGTVEFDHHQKRQTITVNILPNLESEDREAFRVILNDPTGKTMFDETTDGGTDSSIVTVVLNSVMAKKSGSFASILHVNKDQMKLGHAKWREQFAAALQVSGEVEEHEKATVLDWVLHITALPWKLLFALVPPTEYAGGWICFFVALMAIGFVTILIGDLAAMLGCALGISNFATAITFVAMGTSLPDTFASKTAAVQDPTADASIGNVTGSNSVNIFLGLGLPWMIAAVYWAVVGAEAGSEWYERYPEMVSAYPQGGFIVKSDGLGLSVGIFSGCSVACILVLALRRKVFGAELGGPVIWKWATGTLFVLLWVAYIAISIANE